MGVDMDLTTVYLLSSIPIGLCHWSEKITSGDEKADFGLVENKEMETQMLTRGKQQQEIGNQKEASESWKQFPYARFNAITKQKEKQKIDLLQLKLDKTFKVGSGQSGKNDKQHVNKYQQKNQANRRRGKLKAGLIRLEKGNPKKEKANIKSNQKFRSFYGKFGIRPGKPLDQGKLWMGRQGNALQ